MGRALMTIVGAARDNAAVIDPALAQAILDASRSMCADLAAASQERNASTTPGLAPASEQHTEQK
jgi:hypothetical protein